MGVVRGSIPRESMRSKNKTLVGFSFCAFSRAFHALVLLYFDLPMLAVRLEQHESAVDDRWMGLILEVSLESHGREDFSSRVDNSGTSVRSREKDTTAVVFDLLAKSLQR